MKPTTRRVLLALACGLVAWGALAVAMPGPSPLFRVARNVTARVAANVVDLVAARAARAEEMRFEPLSAESSAALERRARRARAAAGAAIPAAPAAPSGGDAPPAVTTPPEPAPPVVIGKTGDIMRVGSDIEIGKDEVVTGDVLSVGGDVTIEGHVEGNAVSMGGDIYLQPTARVDGDVVCMGGELHEEHGAVVGGKRVVGLGSKNIHIRNSRLRDLDIDVDRPRHRANVGGAIGWLICWLIVSWAIAKVAPGRTLAALESFRRGPGTSFLVGWLAIVLTVPALIAVVLLTALLCITIIGIPLGIAVLFAYFLFIAVFVVWGGVVGAAVVGERVAQRQRVAAPSITRLVVGGVLVMNGALVAGKLIEAMGFIPGFGALGKFVTVLVIIANSLIGVTGWGALLYSEFTTGMIARWWHGRRAGTLATAAAGAAPATAPAPIVDPAATGGTSVTTVTVPQGPVTPQSFAPPPPPPPPPAPPPPPPASPPSSFMPPPEGTPPEPTAGS